MKSMKLFFFIILMVFLNVINIVIFSSHNFIKNIIFIIMGVTLWIISIPNLRNTSRMKKLLSIVFCLMLLIIGYASVYPGYWKTLQVWWSTSWLYIPIILFITSKIINSSYFIEHAENTNKKMIFTYFIAFIIVLGIICLIEKITENIDVTLIIHPCLGIVSSALFIYQLYRFLNIKIDINVQNIAIIFIELVLIVLINVSQYQKISNYTNSAENISALINSGKLTYNNIKSEFESLLVEYHDSSESRDTYYNNRIYAFLSLGREWDYSVIVLGYKSSINNTKKKNFNELLDYLKEDKLLDNYIDNNKMCSGFIIFNMLVTIIESILFICISIREKGLCVNGKWE